MKTDVIFRKEKDGDVFAVFPYEIWDAQGNCACYAHVGQHSACSYDYVLKDTKPTNDYEELKAELEAIGYKLNVVKQRDYDKYLAAYYKLVS